MTILTALFGFAKLILATILAATVAGILSAKFLPDDDDDEVRDTD